MSLGKSLQIKMSIILLVSILSIMVASGILMYYVESKRLLAEITRNSKLTFKRLTNSLKEPLWNMDYKEVNNISLTEMENHDVLTIIICNDKGEKIAGNTKDENFRIVSYENTPVKKDFISYETDIVKEGLKVGSLKIYFTDRFLKNSLSFLVLKLFIQTVALAFIIILVTYIAINIQIINPVISLNRTVGQFANKEFDARMEIKSDDEIGSLSENFNSMAKTIQEYSENMEEIVARRTEELKAANLELLETNNQMKKELKMAQKIQEAIIPKTFPAVDKFSFSGMYIPMDSLGGDYYDVIKISENKIGMLIVDVCGHGVPAALITTMAKVSFGSNSKEDRTTGEIVKIVNDDLFNIIGNMEYLTAFFCIIDSKRGVIEYTNAGHPSAIIIKKSGEIVELEQNSPVIGFVKDVEFETGKHVIEDGDRIALYTDGVTEAKNSLGDLFDVERFKNILLSNREFDTKKLLENISKEINKFTENSVIRDDITILIGDFFNKKGEIVFDFEIFSEKGKKYDSSNSTEIQTKIRELNENLYEVLEYNKLEDYEKSLKILEEIKGKYNRKEDNVKILEILGFVNYKLKNFDTAISIWEEALVLDPNNLSVRNNINLLNEKKNA